MLEWYHRLNGHEFEQIPGDSEEQGSLAAAFCSRGFCSAQGHKEMAERLNTTQKMLNSITGKAFRFLKKISFSCIVFHIVTK